MRRSRVWVIAGREWAATVMRREFLLMTFGLPLFLGAILGIVGLTTALTVSKTIKGGASHAVGIYDPDHVLTRAPLAKPIDGVSYQLVSDLSAGEADVAHGRLRALIAVPGDYLASGQVSIYRKSSGNIFSPERDISYAPALRAGLLEGRVPAEVAARVVQPNTHETDYEWDAERHSFAPQGTLQAAARDASQFFVPYGFAMLLMMSILTGSGYLLHGLVEEKENRIMEILLSSVTYEDLLRGKLLGLGAAGLTQIGIWALLGGAPAAIALAALPLGLHIPVVTLLLAVVLFVLGFSLYGSMMAGVGSLGTSWRESQQATAVVTMCAILPVMIMPALLADPNGIAARALSWFPLTAPIALMVRVGIGQTPAWDIALGIALLALGIWLVQRLCAKLFRLGLLLYGKPPTLREVLRWLQAA